MKNYPTFRNVLRVAIGNNRTQAQFAMESNLSATHVSRMLNEETICRPREATLYKIASNARNGITLEQLQQALDQDDPDKHAAERRMKQKEAENDFNLTFEEKANMTMMSLTEKIGNLSYPIVTKAIPEFVDTLLENTAPLEIAYDMDSFGPHPKKQRHSYATHYQGVTLTMADENETAITNMVLFYSEICNADDTTSACIQMVSCQPKDITYIYGISNNLINLLETKGDSVFEQPYILEYHPFHQFPEIYTPVGDSPEERLLNDIFGTSVQYSETTYGIGFWLKEIPPKFLSFVQKHRQQIIAANDCESFKTETEALKKAIASKDVKTIIDTLIDIDYADDEWESDQGWPAVITQVMQKETGFPFLYKAKTKDPSDFPNLSEHDCILLPRKIMDNSNIQRHTALMTVYRYAIELGLETFGDIQFTNVKTEFQQPITYKVKTNESEDPIEPYEEPNYSCPYNEDSKPNKNAIYHVRLIDGRQLNALYIVQHDHWIAKHKKINAWIEAYDPLPIKNSVKTDQ